MNFEFHEQAVIAEKSRFALIYGISAGLIFSIAAWGYDGYLLSRANAIFPWAQFIAGLIPCVIISGLGSWLTYRIGHFAGAFFIWIGVGTAFAWLSTHIPFGILASIISLIKPELGHIIHYDMMTGAQASLLIIYIAVIGLSILAGLLEIPLVDASSESAAAIGRLFPLLAWLFLFVLAGLAPENNLTSALRDPVVNTNELIQWKIDHQGQEISPQVSVDMHQGALKELTPLVNQPRHIILTQYDELLYNTQIAIDFNGTWASCNLLGGFPSYCKPTTLSELSLPAQ